MIAVQKRSFRTARGALVGVNVKYCIDRPACLSGAIARANEAVAAIQKQFTEDEA
jgi:hypothetical protein